MDLERREEIVMRRVNENGRTRAVRIGGFLRLDQSRDEDEGREHEGRVRCSRFPQLGSLRSGLNRAAPLERLDELVRIAPPVGLESTGMSILPAGSGPLYTDTLSARPDFVVARSSISEAPVSAIQLPYPVFLPDRDPHQARPES